jgi:FixJ family two-component response regulator
MNQQSQPVRVAIVDDDPFVRRALHRLLRGAGFAASAHESGEAFLASLEAETPECVVLDIRMGGMSGPDVKHELDRRGLPIRVMFMTAFSEQETSRVLAPFPGVTCLRKPFSASLLIDWLLQANGTTPEQG